MITLVYWSLALALIPLLAGAVDAALRRGVREQPRAFGAGPTAPRQRKSISGLHR